MGHSTGAACVNLLMLSPVAQGMVHDLCMTVRVCITFTLVSEEL